MILGFVILNALVLFWPWYLIKKMANKPLTVRLASCALSLCLSLILIIGVALSHPAKETYQMLFVVGMLSLLAHIPWYNNLKNEFEDGLH
ncbi:hypothetical protein [Neptuniibacter sp. QD37_11]|uniref:hypothetical protein n=1 Tax=Neptuniibacter sp. QD37_11 TaxID=3398209 RepID=UPI0039F4E706